jgi:hypothetical protein
MREIHGDAKTIRELLSRTKYAIDYYQREYKWEDKQVHELVDDPESVRNIIRRYDDIQTAFPEELVGDALPYFVDWLIENVHLVEITAYSDDDAYTIFETMNDRGLSLSPTDMLKGYLLTNIDESEKRDTVNSLWKKNVFELQECGKDIDSDFFKAWLRSQYAESIRERKKGAKPEDFDRIGTEFHRWVREHRERLGLIDSSAFVHFIDRECNFYARHYVQLMQAARQFTAGLEQVFYNARLGFTTQYQVLIAPLVPTDSDEVVKRKFRLVGLYLDILLNRRLWNWHNIGFSTMQYAMFLVMREIRRKSLEELAELLHQRLKGEKETFANNDRFDLNQRNGEFVHLILARLTDFIERESGMPSRYLEYVTGTGKQKYEIEHIWANKPDRHSKEFTQLADFSEYRNRIGGLLLLPKSFNARYGALSYSEKLQHYNAQNLLARSLHPQCYEHNPGFSKFIDRSGLLFKPYTEFHKRDLDERQELYCQIAEQVWNPEQLLAELNY